MILFAGEAIATRDSSWDANVILVMDSIICVEQEDDCTISTQFTCGQLVEFEDLPDPTDWKKGVGEEVDPKSSLGMESAGRDPWDCRSSIGSPIGDYVD